MLYHISLVKPQNAFHITDNLIRLCQILNKLALNKIFSSSKGSKARHFNYLNIANINRSDCKMYSKENELLENIFYSIWIWTFNFLAIEFSLKRGQNLKK